MSQSITATLDAPRPARVPKNLPVPLLTAAAVLAVAHLPLLVAHLRILWLKPWYELFPLVFLGAGVLAAPAWRLVRAGVRASPSAIRVGLVLLGLNWLMLLAAVALESPWAGMISFWELLVTVAVLAGGWPVLRAALPALALMVILIPPPMNLDGRLVYGLQGLTSRIGSRVLDYIGVLHYLDGNTFEVGAKSYFVDKACSGINSLFSTLAVTLFYLLWTRAHWLRGVLLILSAVFWVVVANIIRVSLIVLVDTKLGFDLSKDGFDWEKGMFYQHTVLGFVLFGFVLAMVYSTNQFLRFLGTAVRWGTDESTAGADDAPPTAASLTFPPVRWATVAPALAAYGVLALFQLGEIQLGAGMTESALVKTFNDWKVEDMPDPLGDWQRQPESTFQSRDSDNPFGAHSRTWRYQKGPITATVSFDYPFGDWHDLRLCYKAIGWTLEETESFNAPVKLRQGDAFRDANLECIRFDMNKGLVSHGYCWFTEFDQTGKPVPIREPDLTRSYSTMRWDERLPAVRDRWLSLFGKAQAPPNFLDVLQLQVLVDTYGPITPAQKEESRKFFVQAADLVRGKCAAAAAAK